MLYGVDNDLSEKIAIGDKIYLKEGNQTFGSVSDVIKEDSSVYYTNVANQISESVDSTKKDVAIIIEVNGDVKQDGFFANGVKYVAAGMEIDVFSSDFSGKGLIFGVEQRSE
jgi:ribose 5-phosphate isomerase RpiB